LNFNRDPSEKGVVFVRLVRSLGAAVRNVTRLGGLLMPELPTTVLDGLADSPF
jgi:hypothetical protein